MKILDEELSNKITYTPECQATFQKYKSKLRGEVMTISIPPIFIIIILFGIYMMLKTEHLSAFWLGFLPVGVAISMLFLTSLPAAIKDLKAKKLNIETDTFLKLHIIVDKKEPAKYEGDFEHAGRIFVPAAQIVSIPSNTKVYIIKAAHTNFILDVVPVDKFENELLK